MVVISLIGACLVATAIAWLITPMVMSLAERIGAIDQPNERKIHIRPIPRLGGVAVFVAFSFALCIQLLIQFDMRSSWVFHSQGAVFFVSLLVIFFLGILDDVRTLKPLEKFLVQFLLSSLVYVVGFRVSSIPSFLSPEIAQIQAVDYLITVLWIVGVTNAVNLIDGLDGLASGVAIIASMTIFAVSYINQDIATATVSLVLAGALVGFLRYNFNPARIFLGDSGSLFVGFALAVLAIQSSKHSASGFSLAVPVLALGVPILDTLLAMIRRLLRSFLPKQQGSESALSVLRSIFSPDRSHIHHRLIARGFSHMRAVLLLYIVSIGLGFCAIGLRLLNADDATCLLLFVSVAVLIGIGQLRYREMAILRNGLLLRLYLRLYRWRPLRLGFFQSLVDVGFVAISYSSAYFLAGTGAIDDSNQFWFSLLLICVVQNVVFWITGLYKGTIHQAGVGDALRTAKSVFMATMVSSVVLSVFSGLELRVVGLIFILDLYFILSLVVCSRFSFAALKYLFEKEHSSEKRVLIYGADSYGVLILQNILGFDSQNLTPVGFLDDDSLLEGKYLNGYPIFGGHWKLHRLLERVSVNEILLSSEYIKPEIFKRMKMIARSHGVVIRRFQIRLEDVTREVARTEKGQGEAKINRNS